MHRVHRSERHECTRSSRVAKRQGWHLPASAPGARGMPSARFYVTRLVGRYQHGVEPRSACAHRCRWNGNDRAILSGADLPGAGLVAEHREACDYAEEPVQDHEDGEEQPRRRVARTGGHRRQIEVLNVVRAYGGGGGLGRGRRGPWCRAAIDHPLGGRRRKVQPCPRERVRDALATHGRTRRFELLHRVADEVGEAVDRQVCAHEGAFSLALHVALSSS